MFSRTLFHDMSQMQKEMDNLFNDLAFGRLFDTRLPLVTDRYDIPALNLGEDEHNYYVEAQLPGFDMEKISLSIEHNHLKLGGSRERMVDENVRWHRSERGYGEFERTVRLPRDIDSSKVTAEGRNGVLRIVLPKADSAKPKMIDIKVA